MKAWQRHAGGEPTEAGIKRLHRFHKDLGEADWIIEVGPEGGHAGGRILATGTPEQIAASKTTATGSFLAELL